MLQNLVNIQGGKLLLQSMFPDIVLLTMLYTGGLLEWIRTPNELTGFILAWKWQILRFPSHFLENSIGLSCSTVQRPCIVLKSCSLVVWSKNSHYYLNNHNFWLTTNPIWFAVLLIQPTSATLSDLDCVELLLWHKSVNRRLRSVHALLHSNYRAFISLEFNTLRRKMKLISFCHCFHSSTWTRSHQWIQQKLVVQIPWVT